MKKKNMGKKGVVVCLGAALAGSALLGSTLAYLTDAQSVTNSFTVGSVKIEGDEPHWDPDEDGEPGGSAHEIEPGQPFEKDPQITNVGTNDAYVYVEVEIPMADVIYTDGAGVRQNGGNAAHIELFEFDADGKICQTAQEGIGISEASDNWTMMYREEIDGRMVYGYCYNEILTPGAVTDSLFDRIVFANLVEGQLDGQNLEVAVHFYAIQTVETTEGYDSVAEAATAAFDKYLAQNAGQAGSAVYDRR